MNLSGPEPIGPVHDCGSFRSGYPALDDWLWRRALANQQSDAARTSVVCEGILVRGYFALAAGSVAVAESPGGFRRNMPDPIPVILLGRLAVHRRLQGQGIGRALFRDAARRALAAADIIGARGMIVHAISEEAQAFYKAMGMRSSPLASMTLMVSCAELRAA